MPHNKPESCFVQRVNSCKGCWHHSWQDHNPSLTLINQIKRQDINLPPWVCSPQWYSKMPCNKPESSFVQRVNSREGCWYHSWQDHGDPSLIWWANKWNAMLSGADDVKCGVGECWILWEWTLFWYVRVSKIEITFYIDSYLLDRIRTCLQWSALHKG